MYGMLILRGSTRGLASRTIGMFNSASRLTPAGKVPLSSSFSTSPWRFSSPPLARAATRSSWSHASSRTLSIWLQSMALLVGASVSVVGLRFKSPIHNESVIPRQPIVIERKKSRFNGILNYEELTIGSVTGLFLGVIIGKLSSVLVVLTLAGYFLLQFLQSRQLVTIPWNSIISVGKSRIDVKNLVFEKPSFKLSFVLCFLIAAFNI